MMSETSKSWREELSELIPSLGHRNWIVIADMAYPLQTQPGIKTIYAGESYFPILSYVFNSIKKAPHIKANIYQDMELNYMEEKDARGIDVLKEQMKQLLDGEVTFVPHEMLISRLDEAARMFNVIIIKSDLTIPYSTTFFELDCNYWSAVKEDALQKKMQY